jgi:Tetratricopeptide repeat/NACHT domain
MGKRRILVIGSQCDALPRLSFLPKAAEDLYAVMTDPDFGGCEPALPNGGLIRDPTVSEAKRDIKEAFVQASRGDATLIIAFVGHGEYADRDFYLLPRNAASPPDSENGIHLVQLIKELHRKDSNVDGLVVLLDACYAGVGAADAAAKWVTELAGTLRFEFLAAVANRTAADGCFSRNLADILRSGIDAVESVPVGERVRCEHARKLLITRCPKQLPQLPTYNADDALYLSKNAIYLRKRPAWFGTSTASEIERLTAWFQPTPQLEQIVKAMDTARCVALFGAAGTGKSTLAAALSRPEITAGKVPAGFVHGIVFLSERTTLALFAEELAAQLGQSLASFNAAAESFRRSLPADEFSALDTFERQIAGPLRWMTPDGPVRLIFDGLDHLTGGVSQAMQRALSMLAGDPVLPFLHVLVAARPETPVPPRARSLTVELAATEDLHAYLTRRKFDLASRDAIIGRAAGNWLVAQLLADLVAADSACDVAALPPDLAALYTEALGRAGATDTDRWRTMLRPVLGVLAAAGVGPVLPLKLLGAASCHLGGPSRPTPIHDVLFDMRGFVARSAPGTENEQVGLFHQTLIDYLFGPSAGPFGIDSQEPHAALASAIDALAPMDRHDPRDPLHRYGEAREVLHLWTVRHHERALHSLANRKSVIPAENLSRWQSLYPRIQMDLGADHIHMLSARAYIAVWTGETGDGRRALGLFRELLPDSERVLGADHPNTLTTRNNIAHWTGRTGDGQSALRLCEKLLLDQERVLGADHPDTLTTRNNIAHWTGETGDGQSALRLCEKLLPDQERVLGADHPDTLTTRNNIANWTGVTGDGQTALRLYEKLLPDQARVLGADHPNTLATRNNIAQWIGETGDGQTALRLYEKLLPDRQRVLGAGHPDTLRTRNNIAGWIGQTGDGRRALQLFEELLPDRKRVLGADHPDTLATRNNIAYWTGVKGDGQTALRLYEKLLPDQERVLGADHPDTLATRNNIADWTGVTGDGQSALRLYEKLLTDQERVLGADHPDTLATRNNIADWTGTTGHGQTALRLYEELLPDQERVLGADHPDTLTTSIFIASWTGQTGDGRRALGLFRKLLPDSKRVLGADHPVTFVIRSNIAHLTGQAGDGHTALRLYEELLPDQERVLGADHPDTLATRNNIAHWTGQTGDGQTALRLLEKLLSDMERVLGPADPSVRNLRERIDSLTGLRT